MPSTTFEGEPTFTYKDPTLTEEQKEALRIDAQRAVISEAQAHQWEHKRPAPPGNYTATTPVSLRADSAKQRIFTREEVLTVLKAQKVDISSPIGEAVITSLIRLFERME